VSRTSSELKDLFFQGNYQQILILSWDHPRKRWRLADIPHILGALSFLGRMEEAQTLFASERARLSREQVIAGRFFLGLGFTRKGDYALARHQFGSNLRERGHLSFVAKFYVHQGVSFYRYFCGKWRLALRDSERSFEAALRSHFLYGRVLSADLRGHLLTQMGQVQRGLRILREAQTLSSQMNNVAVSKAIEISRVIYEAQFGLAPKESIVRLKKYLESAVLVQDTYTHSNLLLEVARQYILRGRLKEASEILDQAAQQIYSHQNRRQEVTLNLRFAYLSYLSGDPARGLSFLQAAKRALDPEMDHALRLAALGLEQQSIGALGMHEKQKELRAHIQRESEVYGGLVNRRILARWEPSEDGDTVSSQDPLGDIRDLLVVNKQGAIDRILESGYLIFLLDLFPNFRGKQVVVLDLGKDSVTTFARDRIEHETKLTSLLRVVLRQLAQGPSSKAKLIEVAWKYKAYHPLHHDALIYQAVTALRKVLGTQSDWIETTEQGYQLRKDVELFSFGELKRPGTEETTRVNAGSSQLQIELNHRQIQFLRQLKINRYVNVHEYKKLFGVSEITASRDLSLLHKHKLVVKLGRARATRYARAEES
jgi:DNA-binding winged helix-turn-helix (wHTH) protein